MLTSAFNTQNDTFTPYALIPEFMIIMAYTKFKLHVNEIK